MIVVCESINFGKEAINSLLQTEVKNTLIYDDTYLSRRCTDQLRQQILASLTHMGWSNPIKLDSESGITITSTKNGVGLCLQTGNYARVPYDLVKLQALYINKKIDAAIIIVPTKNAAKKMGSNLANFERIVREANSIFKHVITVPFLVLGIENENDTYGGDQYE